MKTPIAIGLSIVVGAIQARQAQAKPRRVAKPRKIVAACGPVALALGLAVVVTWLGVIPGLAMDKACQDHQRDTNLATHDPKIAARVTQFALQLLAGDPNFMRDWNAYIGGEVRKGDPNGGPGAPDLPNAGDRESDAAVDLHCVAPIEARLQLKSKTEVRLDVDDWRSYVNASVYNLGTKQFNVQQAEQLINKVRPEDRALAAADFSRDCFLAALPYTAHANATGMIEIVEKK